MSERENRLVNIKESAFAFVRIRIVYSFHFIHSLFPQNNNNTFSLFGTNEIHLKAESISIRL